MGLSPGYCIYERPVEPMKTYTPQGKTLYLFSVEAMAFGGKRYRVFLFLKSAAEGKGQFDRDIFPTLFGG